MKYRNTSTYLRRVFTLSLVLMVGIMFTGLVYGEIAQAPKRVVKAGEELQVKGVILTRDGETFVLRDMEKTDTVVLLTDSTTIKSAKKGLFRGGKEFDVTALVPGLILTVKGQGDTEGRLMADKITFKDSDYKAAVTAYAMTEPVDDKADQALRDAAKADQRISDLDDYDVVKVVTVYFAVNKADLSAEGKASLDELAAKAPTAKNYKVEVQGFTDSTGDFNKNLELSQKRADAVVQYLAVMHNIPLRRIETPMGYGSTKQIADDKTKAGQAQNRRVEVRVLVNKGLAETGAKPAASAPPASSTPPATK
jgi:outer membrane protein OmpA-like peptidoglycan-associated protein